MQGPHHVRRVVGVLALGALLALVPGCGPAEEPAPEPVEGLLLASTRAVQTVTPVQVRAALGQPGAPLIVDSRTPREFAAGHIPGAINVPHKTTYGKQAMLAERGGNGIVFYCQAGVRAKFSAKALSEEGFPRIGVMSGHFLRWRALSYPIEIDGDADAGTDADAE